MTRKNISAQRPTIYLKPTREPTAHAALNLWAYMADDGTILRIAGKVYVLSGNKDENLSLLRQLSRKDFLTAPWREVPAKVRKVVADNRQAGPIVLMYMLRDRVLHGSLFGLLIKELAKTMPMQVRHENAKLKRFRVELPKKPLMLSTIILERPNGRQSALIPFD